MENENVITFNGALSVIEGIRMGTETESTLLSDCLNRVLAEPVISDTDMPPFDKSAMDGFACRRKDLSGFLKITGEIPAGKLPGFTIQAGECARIMTGAIIPDGADFVLMKEHAEVFQNQMRSIKVTETDNICRQGEDVKSGENVLLPGIRIRPAHIAMLAATGYIEPLVYKIPELAVISTGDELTEPCNKPEKGKIRNSNGYQITAQARQYGLNPVYLGIIPDQKVTLIDTLSSALAQYKLTLISGGVSVGDYDFIPEVLEILGAEKLFHGLRMKPGKHFLLARKHEHYIACLPGNPVSSLVIFEVLVKPILNRLMGLTERELILKMPIEKDYKRKKSDTLFFIPVSISDSGTALPAEYHGSAHIQAYTSSNGIMEVPEGISEIKKGEIVHVRQV